MKSPANQLRDRLFIGFVAIWLLAAAVLWFTRTLPIAGYEPEPTGYLIDLNTADAPTLELLPGIGYGISRSVVEHREAHGPFQTLDDIQRVRMIGPTVRRAVEPYVSPLPVP